MFVALRDLRFARGRFALMGTVIVLITLLVGLLSGLTAGLGRQNVSAVTALPADRLAFAAPADGAKLAFTDSTVSADQWHRWEKVDGVASAEPLGVTTTRAAAGGRTAAVSAFGIRPGSGLGPLPQGGADGEVVLSAPAAEDLGVDHAGERVTLAGHRMTVARVGGDAWFSHTPVVWTTLHDWQALDSGRGAAAGAQEPHATVVALDVRDGAHVDAADARLGTKTVATGDSVSAIGSYTSENGSLRLMRGFLFAISALVIGAFFTVWTIQRGADVAVLKALGASTRYLMRDALGQAVAVLVLGTAVGSAVAVAAGAALGGAVPFVLTASTVLTPAAVMVGLGVAGAALAVRRITSVDPLTALGSAR